MTDLIPAPRPVPTTEDRMRPVATPGPYDNAIAAATALEANNVPLGTEPGYGGDHERPRADHTFATYLDRTERDQLDARAACAEQERDEALDARNVLRQQLDTAKADRDAYGQVATFRQGVIDRHRQELGAAGEVLAVVRDATERIERALARYDTQPSEPTLGSPSSCAQEPAREEVQWAYRWLDADGNVLDEMDTRGSVHETAEARARRLAANRPPSVPGGQVVRYRVVTTGEVVATFTAEREG